MSISIRQFTKGKKFRPIFPEDFRAEIYATWTFSCFKDFSDWGHGIIIGWKHSNGCSNVHDSLDQVRRCPYIRWRHGKNSLLFTTNVFMWKPVGGGTFGWKLSLNYSGRIFCPEWTSISYDLQCASGWIIILWLTSVCSSMYCILKIQCTYLYLMYSCASFLRCHTE